MKKLTVTALILLMALALPGLLRAEKVGNLPEVMKPVSIKTDSTQLYITDGTAIHIYSLAPFSHIKTFGKRGEGPGEFRSVPYVTVYPHHLVINSMGKIQKFTRDGVFKEEVKLPFMFFYFYYPLLTVEDGNRYMSLRLEMSPEEKKFIFNATLFDGKLKSLKRFYVGGSPQLLPPRRGGSPQKVDFDVVYDCLDMAVAYNRFFIADSRKGFFISVFDQQGNLLYEIKKNYNKLKIPEEFKEGYMREIRNSPQWENLKKTFNYKFKEYFPAFFSFKIRNRKIYVTTYEKKGNRYEIVVLDLEGNILKQSFSFPLHPLERMSPQFISYSNDYDIVNDRLYYLLENNSTEEWELHVTEIK
ncbi:MAG: hypothetical protein GTO45_33275 [Candidatus Aminicenantes bacterium]|nr:hypothetical protein [Candidatus Aminicenantes bacterium]NIM83608.1 hypothetical protein [Candidatus Aminicenantes bacterium]NIN23012.1 hypothetical protein [Candidatus Aminicenantes bacterium]NIN46749.1 hypothetical protein [Candidatus Aminicenantes bacterium]NIN89656.1 hypothetical protein [Candidatus Aminicenantes bacterium]